MRVYLNKIRKVYGDRVILDDCSFEFRHGKKTALVGPNGEGKTTIFSLILGRAEADGGSVERDKGRAACMAQELPADQSMTLRALCAEAFADIRQLGADLDALAARFDALTVRERERWAELSEEFERRGGYEWERRIEIVLQGLGFARADLDRPLSALSGGQKRRTLLAQALLAGPDLLLLDEPTNHLDLESIRWLEEWLHGYSGTVIFISHDRHFLDAVADEIVELERGELARYPGNFAQFREQRAERKAQQRKLFEAQQEYIARTEDFIRRNIAGQKTKQAQSRRRMLEKIERLEAPHHDRSFRLRFEKAAREGHVVAEARALRKDYGERRVLDGVEFTAYRGEKIAILGRNGCGKSTLLRLLIGEERPTAGEIRLGEKAQLGYYPQEGGELDPECTCLEEIWKEDPQAPVEEMRSVLGGFLFSREEADKKVRLLSGGEKSRLLLAKLFMRQPNVLVMDEPTNHLDLPSRILLETALDEYDGTVFLVSHDRAFLDEVATAVYHVRDGGLVRHEGNLSDNEERLFAPPETAPAKGGPVRAETDDKVPESGERTRQALRGANKFRIQKIEERIAELEIAVAACQAEMLTERATRDHRVFKEIEGRLLAHKAELEERIGEWEEACT